MHRPFLARDAKFVKPEFGAIVPGAVEQLVIVLATSVVSALSGLITFKPSRTVLVVSPSLKHGVLGPLEDYKGRHGCCLNLRLLEFATVLLVGLRVPLDLGSALRRSCFFLSE